MCVRASVALVEAKVKSITDVATDILEYFMRNPGAADTLEGIARWRMLEEIVHGSVKSTEQALRWLIERGYLREVSMTGSEPIFLLNSNKSADAEKLLEQNQIRRHRSSG